jgi:hypothetical protein
MPMQLYPENLRKFIGALSSRRSGVAINWECRTDPGSAVPSASSGEIRRGFPHVSRNAGKGVEIQSIVLEKNDEFQGFLPDQKQNLP